jgi:hypothetical protein
VRSFLRFCIVTYVHSVAELRLLRCPVNQEDYSALSVRTGTRPAITTRERASCMGLLAELGSFSPYGHVEAYLSELKIHGCST